MNVKAQITVHYPVAGIHNWPDAPDEAGFLAYPHRHVFHFRATFEVTADDNRQLEFFLMRRRLESFLRESYGELPGGAGALQFAQRSCESLARDTLVAFKAGGYSIISVSVSEDDENSATVSF